ncbi:MerR family transcriptional regulator [Parahaliea mediterranea]|uniref:MerR family transcriptional regulator n=1 Tax=Parahaliea mediterranea TaxID=651086 RepID=A0A939INU9_9GAMM|nr:MerR family transcriptional regulator [Parahaliea mediterranea]MBN7798422.1 MerR family transcriptional regulator [Parahaliea mediterranea]
MTESVLEHRPLYAIGTVARLTGLKPDTLRVWERRYGLGASQKSASGRRQYTQGDLEHLQLVAALVARGARIGEIAGAGRKTLDSLLRQVARNGEASPEPKIRGAFVGIPLCDWLHRHQGYLAGVDALLVRAPADAVPGSVCEQLKGCDVLVLFAPRLCGAAVENALALRATLGAGRAILACESAGERAEAHARAAGLGTMPFPPEPGRLNFELGHCAAANVARRGCSDVGELVQARPREFSTEALAAAGGLSHAPGCECPRDLARLAASLASFETLSARRSARNWRDAAVHARVYAFTAQARWLVERALMAALEGCEADFAAALARRSTDEGSLGDAA